MSARATSAATTSAATSSVTTSSVTTGRRWPGIFALVLAVTAYALVVAGGAVTSTESGNADPDWPSFGGRLLPSLSAMMEDRGLFFEHGHRLLAGSVVLATIVLAASIWRHAGAGRLGRGLAAAAAACGILPAILGGLTVLFETPPELSVLHVSLAMLFLALVVALAVVLGKSYGRAPEGLEEGDGGRDGAGTTAVVSREDASWLASVSIWIAASIYVQIILGAIPRHAYRGEIPHILFAFVIFTLVVLAVSRVFSRHGRLGGILRPSLLLLVLSVVQFFLGFSAYVTRPEGVDDPASGFHELIASSHQAAGALMLVAAVVLLIRALDLRRFVARGLASASAEDGAAAPVLAAREGES
jgi:cytochrome c oxidase assembly protein subunit 15